MEKGSTLLEVLIAIGVFSMAALSIAHLQWVSYRQLQTAYEMIRETQRDEDQVTRERAEEREIIFAQ